MSETDDLCARADAHLDRLDALRRELLDHLDRLNRRLPDVPLHQRGFGVMDEPAA